MVNITKRDNKNNLQNNDKNNETQLSTLSPFSLINQFDRFFDEAMRDPFNLPSLFNTRRLTTGVNFPKVDVSESEKEIKVVANIPGIDADKVDIEVGNDYLSLSGRIEKENKEEDKDARVYRYEREYGEFRREFSLPARVNKEGIVAKAKNGVLTITLPKSEEEKKNKIRVEVEK